jgi:hypothetical protein
MIRLVLPLMTCLLLGPEIHAIVSVNFRVLVVLIPEASSLRDFQWYHMVL